MTDGYRAVTTRQIADACGLTQPALYRHFSDKEQLYVEVLLSEVGQFSDGLQRILERQSNLTETLKQISRYLLSSQSTLDWMFHDIRHEIGETSRERLSSTFYGKIVREIAGVFERGMRDGIVREINESTSDPYAMAFLFMNMLQQGRNAHPNDMKTIKSARSNLSGDEIVNILLHGLVSKRTT